MKNNYADYGFFNAATLPTRATVIRVTSLCVCITNVDVNGIRLGVLYHYPNDHLPLLCITSVSCYSRVQKCHYLPLKIYDNLLNDFYTLVESKD